MRFSRAVQGRSWLFLSLRRSGSGSLGCSLGGF